MKIFIRKIYWILSTQFGINFKIMLRSILSIPRYISDIIKFRKYYHGKLTLTPCLHDWYEEAGATKSEYFWQDLYVAQNIHKIDPKKHVDIGSRIDGFVAHVASFRNIEVFDIRPITTNIPNIDFRQVDFMNEIPEYLVNYCDSISCLHALEHFGLGRYGDPIKPHGHKIALNNISKMLLPNGMLYLSVPIGQERVEFNANRVFNPLSIIEIAKDNKLSLLSFSWIKDRGYLVESTSLTEDIDTLINQYYNLGIFQFIKESE
ncbi:MAG: DUF268 domain-containing protein [Thiolinea sp.]